jgi:anthranilate synthase component 2
MKVLVVDNYDSFTFNLVHYLEDLGAEVTVWRNDEFLLEEVAEFPKILLSPGPGLPKDAGLLKAVITKYANDKSILGVCLGQQAIAEVFGAKLENLEQVYHGISSVITVLDTNDLLFRDLPLNFAVGRYHSWVVGNKLPNTLIATSVDEAGHIMSIRHSTLPIYGVQFHPESVLTAHGKKLLANWLSG